jgi:hypothetical protein
MDSEEMEQTKKVQIRSRGGELEKVAVHSFALQHAHGVRPEEQLVSGQQVGCVRQREEIEIQIQRRQTEQGHREASAACFVVLMIWEHEASESVLDFETKVLSRSLHYEIAICIIVSNPDSCASALAQSVGGEVDRAGQRHYSEFRKVISAARSSGLNSLKRWEASCASPS